MRTHMTDNQTPGLPDVDPFKDASEVLLYGDPDTASRKAEDRDHLRGRPDERAPGT